MRKSHNQSQCPSLSSGGQNQEAIEKQTKLTGRLLCGGDHEILSARDRVRVVVHTGLTGMFGNIFKNLLFRFMPIASEW